jgi:O-acetyl-ADP-ribose deacetylase (regulator of RNase III)
MDNGLYRVLLRYGDITTCDIDAIVNPAHRDLLGGGGLDGMIHDAAGPGLLAACRALGGCQPGDARTTPGFDLPARWIVHTVGPVWRGGTEGEEACLASCYSRCLEEAVRLGAKSLAFPGISTGLHRFPIDLAARIAVRVVSAFLDSSPMPETVVFVCFGGAMVRAYEGLLGPAGIA